MAPVCSCHVWPLVAAEIGNPPICYFPKGRWGGPGDSEAPSFALWVFALTLPSTWDTLHLAESIFSSLGLQLRNHCLLEASMAAPRFPKPR